MPAIVAWVYVPALVANGPTPVTEQTVGVELVKVKRSPRLLSEPLDGPSTYETPATKRLGVLPESADDHRLKRTVIFALLMVMFLVKVGAAAQPSLPV